MKGGRRRICSGLRKSWKRRGGRREAREKTRVNRRRRRGWTRLRPWLRMEWDCDMGLGELLIFKSVAGCSDTNSLLARQKSSRDWEFQADQTPLLLHIAAFSDRFHLTRSEKTITGSHCKWQGLCPRATRPTRWPLVAIAGLNQQPARAAQPPPSNYDGLSGIHLSDIFPRRYFSSKSNALLESTAILTLKQYTKHL